jgi:hypothetical protein
MSCDSSMHIVSHLPYSCISLELFPSGAINESWLNTYGHLLLKANGSGLLNTYSGQLCLTSKIHN